MCIWIIKRDVKINVIKKTLKKKKKILKKYKWIIT